jgi:hypothetical protein
MIFVAGLLVGIYVFFLCTQKTFMPEIVGELVSDN